MESFLGNHIVVTEQGKAELRMLGKGQSNALVLYKSDAQSAEPPALLYNILQAIGLQLEEHCFYLALQPSEKIQLSRLCAQREVQKVIVFGCSPAQLGLKITHTPNTWIQLGGIRILLTQHLSELEQNKDYKKALWEALRVC